MSFVLLINGSPDPNGCIARAFEEITKVFDQEKVESKTIVIGNKEIRGCIGCRRCHETGKCVFHDEVNETAPLLAKADGLIIGSPVYYAHANGGLLSFCDRLFYSTSGINKSMKVGAAVVSSRRAGSTSAFEDINKYFTISGMPIVSSTYWNEVHGYSRADVEADREGLQTIRNLARNMAFLIDAIHAKKEKDGLPFTEHNVFTNFIR